MSARKRPVSNLLGLTVLGLLLEQPMHPYEMATTLRERNKDTSFKVKTGSLYDVVESLERAGWIEEHSTERAGRRPERKVYAHTELGREEFMSWLDELVRAPVKEYPSFLAAVSYLGALGPERAVQALGERITRLGEVAASMDLRRYRDPDGRELLDLPELTVPDEDVPAPPRLLGPFDQTILSYADRTRVISDDYRKRVISQNGLVKGTLLVGGSVRGFWELKKERKAAAVELSPFEKLPKKDLAALESAAGRLAGWAEPDAETREVRVLPPA